MRSYGNRLEKADIPAETKGVFTRKLLNVLDEKWFTISAPDCAREIQILYRSLISDPDPFKEAKKVSNDTALGMYPDLADRVRNSKDPFLTALKLAIAGNIIDFAVHDSCDLPGTIEGVLASDFSVDHSGYLREALRKAGRVLYIGDNAGEIVFDKLFIRELAHPGLTYAVRGGPAINDATMEDAVYTGMTSVARVISSGHDASTTVLEKSGDEFRKYYHEADLIISKGQGNLEGLIGEADRRIFFLLMVKCDVIAEYLKVPGGSYVVYNPLMVQEDEG
jgi:uncharacterized protein with ATP-grasp and redox domains